MTTQITSPELPPLLASAIASFTRGYGLNQSAATLMLLQTAGAIPAGSIRTTTPDMVNCYPAFDFAAIHDGRAMLYGAVLTALEGMKQIVVEAAEAQDTADRRELVEKRDKLQMRNSELADQIQADTARAEQLGRPAASGFEIHQTLSFVDALSKPPAAVEKAKLSKVLTALFEEQGDVQRQLVDVMVALYPGVIREGGDWRAFPDGGRHSFDGHFLQIANVNSLLAETGSRSNRLRDCAELLQRSRSESPITVGSSRVDLQACKLEYSIVSPK